MVVMPNHFHCIWHITKQDADTNIPTVVQWFKTMTTNEYIRGVKGLGWPPFNKRLWQRNYFERIIRNEQAYENIRNYIQTNPERWESDQLRRKGALPRKGRPTCLPLRPRYRKVRHRDGRYTGGPWGGHSGPP
jgi:hypothetical protein